MEIIFKKLKVCNECYRLKGQVLGKNNCMVLVLCICDLKEGKHKQMKTSISGGIILSGEIHLMWTQTYDYLDENGQYRHIPYFSSFG